MTGELLHILDLPTFGEAALTGFYIAATIAAVVVTVANLRGTR